MFEESLKNQEEPNSSDMGPVVQQVEIGKNGNRMTYEGMCIIILKFLSIHQPGQDSSFSLVNKNWQNGSCIRQDNFTTYLYFVKHFVIVVICYINKIIFFNFAFPGRQGQVVSFFVPDDNPGEMIRLGRVSSANKMCPNSLNESVNSSAMCASFDGTPRSTSFKVNWSSSKLEYF